MLSIENYSNWYNAQPKTIPTNSRWLHNVLKSSLILRTHSGLHIEMEANNTRIAQLKCMAAIINLTWWSSCKDLRLRWTSVSNHKLSPSASKQTSSLKVEFPSPWTLQKITLNLEKNFLGSTCVTYSILTPGNNTLPPKQCTSKKKRRETRKLI
jgi:hypothetical protein